MSYDPRQKIEIKGTGRCGETEIYINGCKINNIRSFKLEQTAMQGVSDRTHLTLDLECYDVFVDNCLAPCNEKKMDGYYLLAIHESELDMAEKVHKALGKEE